MSLAQITEKIERDARAEAEKLLIAARGQETQILGAAQAEIGKIESAAKARFERERPEIFRRRDIVAKLDVNKLMLASQRKLIQDVFDGALKKLSALGREEYLSFCGRLLKAAVESGDEVMELAANEKYINRAWLDAFNEKNGTHVTLAETRQKIAGGFLLGKGRICINCSWEMLVQAAQEKLETEVVKRLFPAV